MDGLNSISVESKKGTGQDPLGGLNSISVESKKGTGQDPLGGLNSISVESKKGTGQDPLGGLNSISVESKKGSVVQPVSGFFNVSIATKGIIIQQISITDLLGNIDGYQITNARLYDVNGDYPDVPLTFNLDATVANESNFQSSFSPEKIRLDFTVTGKINNVPFSHQIILPPTITYVDA